MEPVFDPFEVLSIFAEVIVGQLGFQVVAVAVGRSGVSGGSDGCTAEIPDYFSQ